jgi:pyruvate ferredoxin oxidoreductase alpha subunit
MRDAGWIHLFSENAQEAYDNMIQAVRIAEHPEVQLPTLVTTDGFIISHGMENVEHLDDGQVQKFIGEYRPQYSVLDVKKPITVGALNLQDYYFEHRRALVDAQAAALPVIKQIGEEFGKESGRRYGLTEGYHLDDAEYAVVALGSTCGTAKVVVDKLRAGGEKAGLLKIRSFRPFPRDEVVQALKKVKFAAVLDRSDTLGGYGGPVFTEVRSALYGEPLKPPVADFIYGLGGREIDMEMIEGLFGRMKAGEIKADSVQYLGVRE